MPAQSGRTTYIPGKGSITRGKSGQPKTFQGKGKPPAGARKIPEATVKTTPIVTIDDGRVTTSGFRSQRAARRARRATERRQLKVLRLTAPKPTRPSKAPRVPAPPKVKAPPKLSSKPPTYKGAPTAGTPTVLELKVAERRGKLKTNRKGFVTTPAVRQTASTIKRIESKARRRRSTAPLPGLDREQAKVARTVLRRGEKARAIPREKLAAIETGLVESNLRNLSYGDADSKGFRQERTSQYGDGPQGPTNVKAAADRLYHELRTDPGTSSATTPGLLAQAAQGSAFPERYDEQAPQARAIISAYNKGKLKPGERRRLNEARGEAQKLGLKKQGKKATKVGKPGRIPSVVYIGKQAEKKFGLHVGENPAFDTVEPVHTEGSYHYRTDAKGRGEAIDVSGSPEKMLAFDQWVANKWGKGVTELFYDPGISIKNGEVIGGIGGHGDHVHVAVAQPGERFPGGIAGGGVAGPAGAMLVGYGPTTAAAEASARKAGKAASEGKGKELSPYQRYWSTKRKLRGLGVGQSTSAPAASLAELERRYGTAVV